MLHYEVPATSFSISAEEMAEMRGHAKAVSSPAHFSAHGRRAAPGTSPHQLRSPRKKGWPIIDARPKIAGRRCRCDGMQERYAFHAAIYDFALHIISTAVT